MKYSVRLLLTACPDKVITEFVGSGMIRSGEFLAVNFRAISGPYVFPSASMTILFVCFAGTTSFADLSCPASGAGAAAALFLPTLLKSERCLGEGAASGGCV